MKPYYFRGCVGDEDDHYKQVCVTTNTVLLRRFCYNTIRAVFGTNLPVGKNDEDMANWNCVSICCGCNGCNKVRFSGYFGYFLFVQYAPPLENTCHYIPGRGARQKPVCTDRPRRKHLMSKPSCLHQTFERSCPDFRLFTRFYACMSSSGFQAFMSRNFMFPDYVIVDVSRLPLVRSSTVWTCLLLSEWDIKPQHGISKYYRKYSTCCREFKIICNMHPLGWGRGTNGKDPLFLMPSIHKTQDHSQSA